MLAIARKYLCVFVISVLSLLVSKPTGSAEMFVQQTGSSVYLIVIRGEIEDGDAARFNELSMLVEQGAVLLESPGGLVLEGLQIGQRIREKGYTTGVAPASSCASACALIWLGGAFRYMAPTALIGFHAAYLEDETGKRENGMANALVGMYLSELGFSIDTVVFATSAGPEEIRWLNASQAITAGIPLYLLELSGEQTFIGEEAPIKLEKAMKLKLPNGFRWVVLESAGAPSELSRDFPNAVTVKTQNGYYASVIGPFTVGVANRKVKENAWISSDAYLSSGNGFLFEVQ